MAIARFPSIVLDCPDPSVLATFYSTLLDWKAEIEPEWADIRADYGQCISFQKVDAYTAPAWPTQDVPQQMHLDVIVDDLDTAEASVIELGRPNRSISRARRSGSSSTRRATRSASA